MRDSREDVWVLFKDMAQVPHRLRAATMMVFRDLVPHGRLNCSENSASWSHYGLTRAPSVKGVMAGGDENLAGNASATSGSPRSNPRRDGRKRARPYHCGIECARVRHRSHCSRNFCVVQQISIRPWGACGTLGRGSRQVTKPPWPTRPMLSIFPAPLIFRPHLSSDVPVFIVANIVAIIELTHSRYASSMTLVLFGRSRSLVDPTKLPWPWAS